MLKLLVLCLALASVGYSAPRDESKFSLPIDSVSRVTIEQGQWVSGLSDKRFHLFVFFSFLSVC